MDTTKSPTPMPGILNSVCQNYLLAAWRLLCLYLGNLVSWFWRVASLLINLVVSLTDQDFIEPRTKKKYLNYVIFKIFIAWGKTRIYSKQGNRCQSRTSETVYLLTCCYVRIFNSLTRIRNASAISKIMQMVSE